MKKLITVVALLFAISAVTAQTKQVTNKLQITSIPNATTLGTDENGNVIAVELPKGSLANPYVLDKTRDLNTLIEPGFYADNNKDQLYTYGPNYPEYIALVRPFITSVKVEVQKLTESIKLIRQTITYIPVSATSELLHAPQSYVRLGKSVNANNIWGDWKVGSSVQADWNQSGEKSGSYIKNKPDLTLKADKTYVDTQDATKLDKGNYTGTASDLKNLIDNISPQIEGTLQNPYVLGDENLNTVLEPGWYVQNDVAKLLEEKNYPDFQWFEIDNGTTLRVQSTTTYQPTADDVVVHGITLRVQSTTALDDDKYLSKNITQTIRFSAYGEAFGKVAEYTRSGILDIHKDSGEFTISWDKGDGTGWVLNTLDYNSFEEKISPSIRLKPLASPPQNPPPGTIYYNSVDNKLKCHDGTDWQDLY